MARAMSSLTLEMVHLGQKGLPEVEAADADRVEGLDLFAGWLSTFSGAGLAQAGDLLDGGAQVAVLIDVPDDELGDLRARSRRRTSGAACQFRWSQRDGLLDSVFSREMASRFSEKLGRNPSSR